MNKYINSYLVFLDQKIKKIFLYLIVMVILATILELLSISTIIPLILTIFNQELPQMVTQFIPNYEINSSTGIIYILIAFCIIFLCKTFFYIFFSYWKHGLGNEIYHLIQKKLFNKYINNNYSFFVDGNKSLLLKNILIEAGIIKVFLILNITLISEIIILISIIFFLFFLFSKITIFLCIFVLFFFYLMSLFSKKKLNEFSNKKKNYFSKISILTNDIFMNIRPIKIHNKYNFFSKKFLSVSKELAKVHAGIGFNVEYPKYIFEFIFVLVFCFLIYFLTLQEIPTQDIIGTLTIFAFAGLRVIPSVNKILISYQDIQGCKGSVEFIASELNIKNSLYKEKPILNDEQRLFKFSENSIIDVKNLDYHIANDNSQKIIFKNLNL